MIPKLHALLREGGWAHQQQLLVLQQTGIVTVFGGFSGWGLPLLYTFMASGNAFSFFCSDGTSRADLWRRETTETLDSGWSSLAFHFWSRSSPPLLHTHELCRW